MEALSLSGHEPYDAIPYSYSLDASLAVQGLMSASQVLHRMETVIGPDGQEYTVLSPYTA